MSTSITVTGVVATEPRFFTTPGNVPIVSFRLGTSERRYNRQTQKWESTETSWFTVSAFRGLAANAYASLTKGDLVVVTGRLRVREWETTEKSGIAVEIEAEALGHDLTFGKSQFIKTTKKAAEAAAGEPESGPGEGGAEPSVSTTDDSSFAASSLTPGWPTVQPGELVGAGASAEDDTPF